MKCILCDTPIREGSGFCDECGAPARPSARSASASKAPTAGTQPPPSRPAIAPMDFAPVMLAMKAPLQDKQLPAATAVAAVLGAVLYLVPVVGHIAAASLLMGYLTSYLADIVHSKDYHPLPQWKDWGVLVPRGLVSTGISFLYLLPSVIILAIVCLPALGALFVGRYYGTAVGGGFDFKALIGTGGMGLFGFLLGFCLAALVPLGLLMYASTGDYMQSINFGELLALLMARPAIYGRLILIGTGLSIAILVAGNIVGHIPVAGRWLETPLVVGLEFVVSLSFMAGLGRLYLEDH